MSEENKPEGAPETATVTAPEPPSDYREYVKWRDAGEPPLSEKPTATAEPPAPPVKTAPPSEAEVLPVSEEDEEGERTGRGSSRVRRIDRLTRENELLRQQLASLQPRPAPPEPAKAVEAPGKPKLHDYPTLEAYQEALTDFKLDQREAQRRAEAAQAEAKTAEEKIQTEFNTRQDAARSLHADYDDVMQSAPVPQGPGVMAARQAMLEDENGAEILYHLATHPEELKRIAQLAPLAAIREIGRLSATLVSPTPAAGKPKPVISGAPRPPAPLSRPSGGTSAKTIHDEDFARTDYVGWSKVREAQLKGR